MTREERENAIRHIQTAIDLDEWARKRAITALSVDYEEMDHELLFRIDEARDATEDYRLGLQVAEMIVRKHIIRATKGGE